MADLYLTPAEKYTAALGGFYYGDLPEPGTVYTQLIKDILDGSTPDKVPKNILARFIYSLYISDLGDPYPRYELAKLLYWKLHNITPTKSGSIITVTIDGKEDYMTINTDLSRLWYKVLFGSKTDVITELPYIFNTMQNKLSDWELFGNTVQSGTPTPENPIMPQGTGERTGNLMDGNWAQGLINPTTGEVNPSNTVIYTVGYIPIKPNTIYSMSRDKYTSYNNVRFYDTNKVYIGAGTVETIEIISGGTAANPMRTNQNFCCFRIIASTAAYMRLSDLTNDLSVKYMLVEGQYTTSTMPSYQPYGYKIPISSANTTTNVYLGEVESTRQIKKYVFTGEESGTIYSTATSRKGIEIAGITGIIGGTADIAILAISTHYQPNTRTALYRNTDNGISNAYQNDRIIFYDASCQTVEAFQQFCTQQYAAGTPVTVWYVLAEPETGIVNEPLMKIGEYADSMSRVQTGIDIPTVIGQNTLDVLTTVKPSSMSIEYTSADETRSRSKRISLLKSPLKKGLIK